MMAEAAVDSVDCLLCSEECVEPLTLGCEHRFCSRCLREHWAPSLTGDCPQCKRRWSKSWPLDFALKKGDLSHRQTESSVEQAREVEKEKRKLSEQTPESTSDEPSVSQGVVCEQELRGQVYVRKLKEKKERTEDVMKQYKSMLEHTEGQRLQCEAQIRAQFNLLHQLLIQEEMDCLCGLRKEQLEKTRTIEYELKKLQDELDSVSDRICSAEQQLQGQSTESSSLKEHMESLVLTDEPELRSGLLIDQATVLGNLGYRVWEKMGTIVNYYSPVFLDPNTASTHLCLSEDLTSMWGVDPPVQHKTLNPERFTNYSSVLGSKGFITGWHWWGVEVGDHPDWSIGVVSASAERRASCEASPENGFWCLTYRHNKYTDANGKTLRVLRHPETIWVLLDCDKGRLSFYDTKDWTLICSHRDHFIDKLFPYFSVGEVSNTSVTKEIQICKINADFETISSKIRPRKSESAYKSHLWSYEPKAGSKKPKKKFRPRRTSVPPSLRNLKEIDRYTVRPMHCLLIMLTLLFLAALYCYFLS